MSVAIIGTVALDSIETPKGVHERILGGSAAYAGVAASLFSKTALVSVIGHDFPAEHMAYFHERGLDTSSIAVLSGETFHWKGYYKEDMSQAFSVKTDLNVLTEFDPVVSPEAENARVVFLANIDPVLQQKAIAQFKKPALIVMDSMNYWIESHLDRLKETLRLVDVVILNDQEIRLLTGLSSVIQAMPAVLAMGPKRVIVKKGEHGAVMFNGESYFSCPAVPLFELADPTGAGDSFAGALCGYLARETVWSEETFRKAVLMGVLVSSFTVRDFSIGALKPLNEAILHHAYREYYDIAGLPTGF
jgi:sugar/nucleoside kinase (ribokinase family)